MDKGPYGLLEDERKEDCMIQKTCEYISNLIEFACSSNADCRGCVEEQYSQHLQ